MKIPENIGRHLGKGGAIIALCGGLWWAYGTYYAQPRRELESRLNSAREHVASMQRVLKGKSELTERSKLVAAELLSEKVDELSARFRDGLARVVEQQGLVSITVEAGQPQDESSPLLSVKGVPVTVKRELRKAPDFAVVRGSVRGLGTLEQVAAALAAIQSQPWIHRIDGFTLKPRGKDREQFELRIEVATLFAPDVLARAGVTQPDPKLAFAPAKLQQMAQGFGSKNIFKKPPIEATQAPTGVSVVQASGPGTSPPQPQAFAPYEDWRLSGLAVGSHGSEALLENTRTGAMLTIQAGGSVLDAVFVEGAGERAVFEISGKRFEVSTGQSLAARRPLG